MAYGNHRDVTETSTGNRTGEYAAAYAAGERIAEKKLQLQAIAAPIVGDGATLPTLSTSSGLAILTALLESPIAPAAVKVQAPESLVAYAQRFGTSTTVLFVEDQPQPRLTLVIDYHHEAVNGNEGSYDWARHRAVYEPLLTPEWRLWTEASGKPKSQVDFARFIEDNLPDIASPAGADVLEMARTLEVKRGVDFRSSVRLDNGETQLRYEETLEGTAGKGQLQIPDHLVLGLQPYKGAAKFAVKARLRYRLHESKLSLWVDLDRVHKVLDEAVTETLRTVSDKLPDVPLFWGPAPAVPSSDPITVAR